MVYKIFYFLVIFYIRIWYVLGESFDKSFYCYFDPNNGKQLYPEGTQTKGWDESNSSIKSCIDKVSGWGSNINSCNSRKDVASPSGYCGWCAVMC